MLPLAFFLALLRITNAQTISTASANSIAMCPCVQTGQSQCQQFDRRYQAHTLEDAMASFNDLTLDRTAYPPSTVPEDEYCETEDCQNCRLFLQGKLKQIGLMEETPLEAFVKTDLTNKTCDRYRFSTPEGQAEEQGDIGPFSSEESGSDEIDMDEPKEEEKDKKKKKKNQRHKRQSVTPPVTDGGVIGQRYTISCTKRGASTDASGRVSLCSSCWVWRKLPAEYVPPYVNELICDTTDTGCLSGYATCSVGTHTIDVVKNVSGVLKTEALTAGSYCECKPNVNSAIQTLVSGSGLKTGINPMVNATQG